MNKPWGRVLIALMVSVALCAPAFAGETYAPYLRVGTFDGNASSAAEKVKEALTAGGFEILGEYSPEEKPFLGVIVYSNAALRDEVVKVKDRGLLAGALKIGLKESAGKTTVSMVNPEYLFRAYLMKEFKEHEAALKKIADDAQSAMKNVGTEFAPFGGALDADGLKSYHYMFGMEYFTEPVNLKTFASFEEGVATITKNLQARAGGAAQVFAIVRAEEKAAVFGIALNKKETGEKHFLPIIGEDHVAAMPYEMALYDKKATMLHGRYRIALHWPSLTMGTFGKIMSTPGEISDTMREVVK